MSFTEPIGVRGTWVYKDGELVKKEIKQKAIVNAPFIKVDEVDAFENPVTGRMETSMSTYRRNLKNAGYFEKGNERLVYKLPTREERYKEVRDAALEAERQIKYGSAESTSGEREVWERQNREMQK